MNERGQRTLHAHGPRSSPPSPNGTPLSLIEFSKRAKRAKGPPFTDFHMLPKEIPRMRGGQYAKLVVRTSCMFAVQNAWPKAPSKKRRQRFSPPASLLSPPSEEEKRKRMAQIIPGKLLSSVK